MTTLKIVKMFDDVKVPSKQNPTDSGFDLYVYSFKEMYSEAPDSNGEWLGGWCKDTSPKSIYLEKQERVLINTGIKATVGRGYEIQIRPRSGLALKRGLTVLNTPATIDEAYKGQLGVILINLSNTRQEIKIGERIAQLVVCPVELSEIEIVSDLEGDDRGGGFGHSGNE